MESYDFQFYLFLLCHLLFCVLVLSFSSVKFLFMASFRSFETAVLYEKAKGISLSDFSLDWHHLCQEIFIKSSLEDMFIDFGEERGRGEKEGEKATSL